MNETGFEYFDTSIIVSSNLCSWRRKKIYKFSSKPYIIQPGGLGNITVLDMEENFLSELVDYANNTLTKDIRLIIPAANQNINWPGLKPNAKLILSTQIYNILTPTQKC